MYSKEEAAKLRQEFWISFGKSFPYKWTLYKTGVKNLSFRFYFDTKKAMVFLRKWKGDFPYMGRKISSFYS